MKKVFELSGQDVANIYDPGELLGIDVEGYSRMSPDQARALAKWLVDAADFVDTNGKNEAGNE